VVYKSVIFLLDNEKGCAAFHLPPESGNLSLRRRLHAAVALIYGPCSPCLKSLFLRRAIRALAKTARHDLHGEPGSPEATETRYTMSSAWCPKRKSCLSLEADLCESST
jgi:hypothetical protein